MCTEQKQTQGSTIRDPHEGSEKRGAITDAAVQVIGSGVGAAVGAVVTAKISKK